MSKLLPEFLGRLFRALADLAAVNHHVVVAGDAIDPDGTEGKLIEAHRCTPPVHALFFDVTTVKADQRCSTFLLPQCGHTTSPFS